MANPIKAYFKEHFKNFYNLDIKIKYRLFGRPVRQAETSKAKARRTGGKSEKIKCDSKEGKRK